MRVPNISRRSMSRVVLTQFGGVNRTPDISEGEWADAENLTSDRFPAFSARGGEHFITGADFDAGEVVPLVAYNEGLVELIPDAESYNYDHLYFKGEEVVTYNQYMEDPENPGSGDCIGLSRYWGLDGKGAPRQAVCFGTKVIFLPYRTYFDVATGEVGTLYRERNLGSIRIYPMFADGTYIRRRKRYVGADAYPYNVDPSGQLGRETVAFQEIYRAAGDTGTQEYNVYQGAPRGSDDGWQLQTKIKYKIFYRGGDYPAIDDGIYEGDRITLDMTYSDGVTKCRLSGAFTVDEVGAGFIVVSNNILNSAEFFDFVVNHCTKEASDTQDEGESLGCLMSLIVLLRDVPEMSWLCANNNRLFGCSPDGHTIYASYLGDPFNWTNYEATSMASYFATVASPGVFTGCLAWEDRVVFFKEKYIHVLSGYYPAEFSISDIETPGPRAGTPELSGETGSRFLDCVTYAVVSGVVYFGAADGVYRWSGGYAQKISDKLGEGVYSPRDAFAVRDKFYIYMTIPGDSGVKCWVYDTSRGIWHAETGFFTTSELYQTSGHCEALGGVILARARSSNSPYLCIGMDGVGGASAVTTQVIWYAESGVLGGSEPDRRYIGKIQITADVPAGGELHVQLMYNGDGLWRDYVSYAPQRRATQLFPIIPRRCDNVRFRLHGVGDVVIYNISYYYERGSEYGNYKH